MMQRDPNFFAITDHLKTPFVIFNLDEIERNYNSLSAALPRVKIHYAVKCNPEPRVLQFLYQLGAGFEIASLNELENLLALQVPPEQIICMHPIKSPEFLTCLHHHGVRIMAVDSYEEVDKIATYAPNSQLVVRL